MEDVGALLVLLFTASTSFAAGSGSGGRAKAMGMGFAFTAQADDRPRSISTPRAHPAQGTNLMLGVTYVRENGGDSRGRRGGRFLTGFTP